MCGTSTDPCNGASSTVPSVVPAAQAPLRLYWSPHDDAVCPPAWQVLDAYEGTQQEEPASEAYERSELLLYKASVLAEGGKHAEALSLLDGNQVLLQSTSMRVRNEGPGAGCGIQVGVEGVADIVQQSDPYDGSHTRKTEP